MPQINKGPRKAILLRVEPEIFDLLTEFSELSGLPRSEFLVGMLSESKEALKGLIHAAKEAKRGAAPSQVLRSLQATLAEATKGADQLSLDIDAKLTPTAVKKGPKKPAKKPAKKVTSVTRRTRAA